jgi:trimethylamine---corrinoid protein Co-methyltransferase
MKSNDFVNIGPQFKLLSENQIKELHFATIHVLEETGVKVDNDEAIILLRNAGARVSKKNIVNLPSYLIQKALSTAPKTVTLHHRDRKGKMVLEGQNFYFGTGSGCPFTYDINTGEMRKTKTNDTKDFAILADYLQNIDFVMSMGNCSDVPKEQVYLKEFENMVCNTTKPICFTAEKLAEVEKIYNAAFLISGSKEIFKTHPFAILYDEPQAPLCHPDEAVKKLLFCAEEGLPVIYAAGVAAGGTGPVTLAGAVVQANAEELSGLVIHQLKREGAPYVYGCTVTILDMATANYTHACPEQFIMNTARAELAHYYNLPIFGVGGRTDSKVPDFQAGLEYALSTFIETLCGAGMIHDVGYLGTGLISSYEMVVMVNELIAMIKRIMSSMNINRETLAEEVINSVGPGGQYLTHDHTNKNFRKELWIPEFISRENVNFWIEKGRPELTIRLNAKVKKILKEHTPAPLPNEILSQIYNILS